MIVGRYHSVVGHPKRYVMMTAGTRPEILKLNPILRLLKITTLPSILFLTNQQGELARSTLVELEIESESLVSVRHESATLISDLCRIMDELDQIVKASPPSAIIIQGDTLSVLATAQVASFNKIPIIYIEAGLRTFNTLAPFPEEIVRRIVSQLSTINFAPTNVSAQNLIREGISEKSIHIVGNTSIDNLRISLAHSGHTDLLNRYLKLREKYSEIVLVTSHRRELQDQDRISISLAINELSKKHPDWLFIFPKHTNPNFSGIYDRYLLPNENIHRITPLDNKEIIALLRICSIVMTDSGGIQEEATALACPLIVLRDETERPECLLLESTLLGFKNEVDLEQKIEFLVDGFPYRGPRVISNSIFGDGYAAEKISEIIVEFFGDKK
jgi:UDP-N-acetylglucosamine 2-epimerase (non-hydrolysing)